MHFFVDDDALELLQPINNTAKPAVRTTMAVITRLVVEEAFVSLDEDGQVVEVMQVTDERRWTHAHVLEEMALTLQ